jgi:hypothetical protein
VRSVVPQAGPDSLLGLASAVQEYARWVGNVIRHYSVRLDICAILRNSMAGDLASDRQATVSGLELQVERFVVGNEYIIQYAASLAGFGRNAMNECALSKLATGTE